MEISIIMPVLNSEAQLGNALAALAAQETHRTSELLEERAAASG